MSLTVNLRPEARSDIRAAARWYRSQKDGLDQEFLAAVGACLTLISEQPRAFAMILHDARRAPLRRFPYSIVYTVSDEYVEVLACVHDSRDPQVWQRRL